MWPKTCSAVGMLPWNWTVALEFTAHDRTVHFTQKIQTFSRIDTSMKSDFYHNDPVVLDRGSNIVMPLTQLTIQLRSRGRQDDGNGRDLTADEE